MTTKNKLQYILAWFKKIKAIEILGGKCQNCGENRQWLLIFHHKNPNEKEFNIKDIRHNRWSLIENEILKCDLLCERCHRELHYQNNETGYTKSKKILLEIKSIDGCEICGYNNCIGALDFHHINDKNFNLNTIKLCENSCNVIRDKILNEINKCTILCANCHKNLHFDKEKYEKYENEIKNYQYKEKKEPLNSEIVMDLYNSGMTRSDIAKKLNRGKTIICRIINKFNQNSITI